MPGEAKSSNAKYLCYQAASTPITGGDLATGGATLLGQVLPSSDYDGEAEIATDESADGPVGVGADLDELFRVEGIDAADMTTLQALARDAQVYVYLVAPGLDDYTTLGPGRISMPYHKGKTTDRTLPHSLVRFTARGSRPEDLIENETVAVTLP